MKDVVGNDLEVGDFVAFIRPRYRELVVGEVVAFTPKRVKVNYLDSWPQMGGTNEIAHLVPHDVAKVAKDQVTITVLSAPN